MTKLWKQKGQNLVGSLTFGFFPIEKNLHYELVILCIYFLNVVYCCGALILPWDFNYEVLP
jgi:hypothetical protein